MFDPDGANQPRGDNLRRLVNEVRREFFERGAHEVSDGYWLVNSARVVAIEVYDRLSIEAQIRVVVDLMQTNAQYVLSRDTADIFARSDTTQAHIADLICEVVYEELMKDPLVAMENESREALFR
jgi:hypothetical protein